MEEREREKRGDNWGKVNDVREMREKKKKKKDVIN